MGATPSSTFNLADNPGNVLKQCRAIKQKFFPRNKKAAYVILDLETTGLNVQEDWPIEVAALFVTGGPSGKYDVVHSYHSHFDWVGHKLVNEAEFRSRLNKTNEAMKERNPEVVRPTTETLIALGKNPHLILNDLGFLMRDFFTKMGQECLTAICGHNVFFFDANFLHHTYARAGIMSPLIGTMLDTGMITKAAQIEDSRLAINSSTILIDWMREVRNMRARAKWALQTFCVPNFGLDKLLPDFVLDMPHSSLTDVWTVMAMLQLLDSQEA